MKLRKTLSLFAALLLCPVFCFGCGETPKVPEQGGNPPAIKPDDDVHKPAPVPAVSVLTFDKSLNEEYVNWYGRVRADGVKTDFSNSSAGFEVSFTGTSLTATIISAESSYPNEAAGNAYAYVFLDGVTNYKRAKEIQFNSTEQETEYVLAENLNEGKHTVKLLKRTEAKYGTAALVKLETDGGFETPPEKPSLKFEIIGDSIMSGSESMRSNVSETNVTESENTLASYGYVAASEFRAQVNCITRSGALVSGYNGYASIPQYYDSYSQIDVSTWDFSRYQPDVILLDLGTNDRLIGAPSELIAEKYVEFVRHLREKNPAAAIFCCEGAMLDSLKTIVSNAVKTLNQEGDGRVWYYHLPNLRIAGGHPTESDHRENGYALADFIRETLELSF